MRKFFLTIVILIFVITLPIFLGIYNFSTILTPELLLSEIKRPEIITKIDEVLPEKLAQSMSGDVNTTDVINRAFESIPSEDVKKIVVQNVDENLKRLKDPKSKTLIFDASAIKKYFPAEQIKLLEQSGQSIPEIKDAYSYPIPYELRIYRFVDNHAAFFIYCGSVFFLLLIILIALLASSPKTKLRAISIALLIPGISFFIPFLIIRSISISFPHLDKLIYMLANDFIGIIQTGIANLYIKEGFLLSILALFFFLISCFIQSTDSLNKKDHKILLKHKERE